MLGATTARAQDDAPPPATSEPDCSLKQYASIDLHASVPNRILVPADIEGHRLVFIIDTGAPVGVLKAGVAFALHLPFEPLTGRPRLELVGKPVVATTHIPSLELGGMSDPNPRFGLVPNDTLEGGVAGTLGADIWQNFNIEFDFAANKMNLFAPDHCPAKFVYWTKEPFAAIPFHFDQLEHIIIPVAVDGVRLEAIVDTGAPAAIVMNLDSARAHFSWAFPPPELKAVDEERGHYTYPFKLLSLAGASVHNPSVRLDKSLTLQGVDLLVGAEALRAFHVFISYKDKVIYLTARDAH